MILIFVQNQAAAQGVMDELAGTQQRLSMTCFSMLVTEQKYLHPDVSRTILEVLNENIHLRMAGESNTQFLQSFVDFHAGRSGIIAVQEQRRDLVDQAYRSSFLIAQMATSGDIETIRNIAEACVLTFSASR
jgi:hypothetical protein